jgi:hypothetical protein
MLARTSRARRIAEKSDPDGIRTHVEFQAENASSRVRRQQFRQQEPNRLTEAPHHRSADGPDTDFDVGAGTGRLGQSPFHHAKRT